MEPVIDHIEITVRDVSTAVSFGRKSLERRNGQGRSASTSQAHMENGAGSAPRVPPDRMLQMVRNLLTDRFKLVVHWDKREQAIYALTLAWRRSPWAAAASSRRRL